MQARSFICFHSGCPQTFKSESGRTRHYNTIHREPSPDSEPDPAFEFSTHHHPKLNGKPTKLSVLLRIHLTCFFEALPCTSDGEFLSKYARPPPPDTVDATDNNAWDPFEDRLAFDWAHYHFVELQSSERQINKGLDLWLAANIKAGSDTPLPWSSADDMYTTIDSIQEGNTPFKTVRFKYNGPLPAHPPRWMLETYELCTRDSRAVLHHQLATTDFADQFNYKPYRQFNSKGDRVWSNLMSGDWAWKEAVCFCMAEYL